MTTTNAQAKRAATIAAKREAIEQARIESERIASLTNVAYATLAQSLNVDAKIARAKLRRECARNNTFMSTHFVDDDKRWIVKALSVDTISAFIVKR